MIRWRERLDMDNCFAYFLVEHVVSCSTCNRTRSIFSAITMVDERFVLLRFRVDPVS